MSTTDPGKDRSIRNFNGNARCSIAMRSQNLRQTDVSKTDTNSSDMPSTLLTQKWRNENTNMSHRDKFIADADVRDVRMPADEKQILQIRTQQAGAAETGSRRRHD